MFLVDIMSDRPSESDKTALLNRVARLEMFVDHLDFFFDGLVISAFTELKIKLDLLTRKAELDHSTALLDQLGTDAPLALRICNEVFKKELHQVTAQLLKLGE